MPTFHFRITDGREAETSVQAENAHEAMNVALNALTQFACKAFPPPEDMSISISDEERRPVAALKFRFEIDYAPGMRM